MERSSSDSTGAVQTRERCFLLPLNDCAHWWLAAFKNMTIGIYDSMEYSHRKQERAKSMRLKIEWAKQVRCFFFSFQESFFQAIRKEVYSLLIKLVLVRTVFDKSVRRVVFQNNNNN
jgi:hypothetical protein